MVLMATPVGKYKNYYDSLSDEDADDDVEVEVDVEQESDDEEQDFSVLQKNKNLGTCTVCDKVGKSGTLCPICYEISGGMFVRTLAHDIGVYEGMKKNEKKYNKLTARKRTTKREDPDGYISMAIPPSRSWEEQTQTQTQIKELRTSPRFKETATKQAIEFENLQKGGTFATLLKSPPRTSPRVAPHGVHLPPKGKPKGHEVLLHRTIASQMKYLPGKSMKRIAFTKQLRVNGTRKQRDLLEENDFKILLDEFTAFSFSRKEKIYKMYTEYILQVFNRIGIYTVKDLVKNIMHLQEYDGIKEFQFNERELDTLLYLGAEWLHYQILPRGEKDDDVMETSLVSIPYDFAMTTKWTHMKPTIWLGDSGASCHLCNSDSGLLEWRPIQTKIKIGNGKLLQAQKIGKMVLEVHQKSGRKQKIVLNEVQYVPDLAINLF